MVFEKQTRFKRLEGSFDSWGVFLFVFFFLFGLLFVPWCLRHILITKV